MSYTRPHNISDFWDAVDLPVNRYDSHLHTAFDKVVAALQSTDWSTRHVHKDQVTVSTRSVPNSVYEQVRGDGVIVGASPEAVIEIFIDPDHRSLHDPTAHSCKVLYDIDRLTRIEYSTFSAPFPVSYRDLLAVGRVQRMANGALLNYATSIDISDLPVDQIDPAMYETIKNSHKVRAQLEFYGLLVTPLTPINGQPRCQVNLVASTNPGGILPAFLTNQSQLNQPLCIYRAQHTVRERPDLMERIRVELPQHYAAFGFPATLDTRVSRDMVPSIASVHV